MRSGLRIEQPTARRASDFAGNSAVPWRIGTAGAKAPRSESWPRSARPARLKGSLDQGIFTMVMSIIGWILFGLVAGAIARLLHPGRDPMGWLGTMLLGVCGSLLGGAVAYLLRLGTTPYQPAGWIFSILGAIILLALGFFATHPRRTVP
jgi:uncharacterized membrane protein YeaQ/YmgE (transglycosylase-associated protein family)